jgi:hypothetical protein
MTAPKDLEIYQVGTLTKMMNSIPKSFASHMITKLALIQYNIASSFPILLQGNRYFLLIIERFTRTNLVLILKEKSDAKASQRLEEGC